MADRHTTVLHHALRAARIILLAVVFVAVASSVIGLPPVADGLSVAVDRALPESSAASPITATLLDFRGYDTLIELAVLFVAAIAIGALRRDAPPPLQTEDDILSVFSRALVPLMLVIAGYLLAAGFDAAGGAFQAGAVLAAAGVLMVLAGRHVPMADSGVANRIALATGLAVFLGVGIAGMLTGDAFLDHPRRGGGAVLLALEIGVVVSVARVLLDLFVGVLAGGDSERPPDDTHRDAQ